MKKHDIAVTYEGVDHPSISSTRSSAYIASRLFYDWPDDHPGKSISYIDVDGERFWTLEDAEAFA